MDIKGLIYVLSQFDWGLHGFACFWLKTYIFPLGSCNIISHYGQINKLIKDNAHDYDQILLYIRYIINHS